MSDPVDTRYRPFDVADIPLRGRHWIEASAGTGKTHAITELYLRLLLNRPDLTVANILVLTYTTAAAAELRDRIRRRLVDELTRARKDHRQEAAARLDAALADYDRAPIGTLHAFCLRQLQDHSLDCRVPVPFTVEPSTAEHDEEIVRRIVRQWLGEVRGRILPVWTLDLADPARLPALIRMATRLGDVRLEPPPEAPDEVLDTDQALVQAVEAAQKWFETYASQLHDLGTHKLSARKQLLPVLLTFRQWLYDLGVPPVPETPESPASDSATEPQRKHRNPAPWEPLLALRADPATHPAVAELGAVANELSRRVREAAVTAKTLAARFRSYLVQQSRELRRAWFRRLGVLSYDEMIHYVREALRGPHGDHLAARWAQEFRVALVDEFQDTDPAQYDILEALAQHGMDLYLIGDPKQSVYAFRGADIFTYCAAARAPGIQRYTMQLNWRSSPGLVEAVQHLFRRPRAFALDFVQMVPVQPAPDAAPLTWDPREGPPCSIWWLADAEKVWKRGAAQTAIAGLVARQIARWLDPNSTARLRTKDGTERPIEPSDIAVLVPRHAEARTITRALRRVGVPVITSGLTSVFDTEDADHLYVLLRSVLEPRREDYLRAATLILPMGRAPADLADPDSEEWIGLAERWLEYHRLWVERGVRVMLDTLWTRERCFERLLRRPDGARHVTNLRHLTDLLAHAEFEERLGPSALLRYLTLQIEAADANYEDAQLRLDDDQPRVRVTTIHQSKGLQYPIVVLPYLWSLGPRTKPDDDRQPVLCHDDPDPPHRTLDFGSPNHRKRALRAMLEEFQETLRLTYVAVTRAQAHLVIAWGPIKDTSSSPLAWLWHAPVGEDSGAPSYVPDNPNRMRADLQKLAESSHGTIGIWDVTQDELSPSPPRYRRLERHGPVAPPRTFHGVLDDGWRVLSYTVLRGAEPDHRWAEEPDYDREPSIEMPIVERPPTDGRFQFPSGAGAGQVLHSLLETVQPEDDLETLIPRAQQSLEAAGLEPHWAPVAARIVLDALHTPLDATGWTLRELDPARAARELPFFLRLARHPPAELVRRLRGLAQDTHEDLPHWMLEPAFGFLRGFIDLVFERNGRWYIVDYKSNWCGPDWDDYRAERLAEEMRRADYELQAMLYAVAWRQLALARGIRDPEFRERWGGVFYLFLRGLSPSRGPSSGVYVMHPAPEQLVSLGNYLASEEVTS